MIENGTKVVSISLGMCGRVICFSHNQNAYLISFGEHGYYYCYEKDLIVMKDQEDQND